MAELIELRGATKRFPTGSGGVHTAVRDLTMTVGHGEFVAVVGPTGCGKSTTLSLVSGLEPPSEGEVLLARNSRDVDVSELMPLLWHAPGEDSADPE